MRSIGGEMFEDFEEKTVKALTIAIIIACLIALSVYLFNQEKPLKQSRAYFKPESLSNQLKEGKTFFTLILENLEGKETAYNIYYYANDFFLGREGILLKNQASTEIKKEFEIEKFNLKKPIKVKVRIETPKGNIELFYWIE